MNDDDYGAWQSPGDGYGDSQQPGTLYADKGGASQKPKAASSTQSGPQVGAAASAIRVSVNPASKIKLAAFVELLNKTPGIVPELKGKLKLEKKTSTITVPDFSRNKLVPGKEWLFDLGKAGDDWEVTTATLKLVLDGPTYFKFDQDLGTGEERGRVVSADPDDSLLEPPSDFTNALTRGLLLGLTIPSQALLDKNPPPPNSVPPPQIARLKTGKGLILIARRIVVAKGNPQKVTTDAVAIPNGMIAMTFFHEVSAHGSFFQLGQNAAHSDPLDPANNPVDRNAAQAESTYRALLAKEQDALEKKLQGFIAAMRKAVP